jgi:CRP-like cAMP-binding protein
LRRIKALAEMTDEQLSSLLTFIEIVHVPQFTHLVRKGDPGDAMYGVLEGELRSCILVDGKECPLATLGAGAVFGELSLFDKGPHAADVVANQDSVLAKITASAVARICGEAPDAALPMVLGLINVVAGRVRTLTKRYEDSVQIAQGAEALQSA